MHLLLPKDGSVNKYLAATKHLEYSLITILSQLFNYDGRFTQFFKDISNFLAKLKPIYKFKLSQAINR